MTACCTASPIAARPNTRLSTPRNHASSASFDLQSPAHGAAIEQDGLLRQPLCRATRRHGDPRANTRSRHCPATPDRTAPPPAPRSLREPRPRWRTGCPGHRLPAIPPDVFSVTTFSPPASSARGNRAFRQPACRSSSSTDLSATSLHRHRQVAGRPLQIGTDRRDIHHRSAASAGRCHATATTRSASEGCWATAARNRRSAVTTTKLSSSANAK